VKHCLNSRIISLLGNTDSEINRYRYCSCCPARDESGRDSCGGDAGGVTCNGIDQYQGI
jgi:hypothetical protein